MFNRIQSIKVKANIYQSVFWAEVQQKNCQGRAQQIRLYKMKNHFIDKEKDN